MPLARNTAPQCRGLRATAWARLHTYEPSRLYPAGGAG